MTQEISLLNEVRLLHIACKRGLARFCKSELHKPTMSGIAVHYIYAQGGSVLQKDVEGEFNLRRSTACRLLQKMEGEGYITRAANEEDSRGKRIYLTEKAIAEQETMDRIWREADEYIRQALTDEECETFVALLRKICHRLEA